MNNRGQISEVGSRNAEVGKKTKVGILKSEAGMRPSTSSGETKWEKKEGEIKNESIFDFKSDLAKLYKGRFLSSEFILSFTLLLSALSLSPLSFQL